MRIKFSFIAALLLLCLTLATASAQTTQITGKVTLKQADNTEPPLAGATVTLYRTDINSKPFEIKTNKKGEYVRLGIPFGATYTVVVSAPGARPTFQDRIRPGQQTEFNFALNPGDGSTLTLEQVNAAIAAAPSAGGGAAPAAAAPAKESAEARAKREALERERAEIEAKNAKATELNAKLPEILKAGNSALEAKKYDQAIASYDQGIAADPTQGVFHLNKSVALRQRGVESYNAAIKSKDKAARTAAVADIKAAADSSEKAAQAYRQNAAAGATPAAGGGGAGASPKSDALLPALEARAETYRIAMLVNAPDVSDAAVKAIEEYVAAEPDEVKKNKRQADLGDAYFQSNRIPESIATYEKILAANPNNLDAMYGYGVALSADPARATEASDMLKKFAAKAGADRTEKKQQALAIAQELEAAVAADKERRNSEASKPKNSRRKG